MEPNAPSLCFVNQLLILNVSIQLLTAWAHADVYSHMCGIRQLKRVVIAQMASQAQAPFVVCIKYFISILNRKFQHNKKQKI